MAFSRYRSTGRRSYSPRFRRRRFSRLSTFHRPIRWERGNFYLTFLHTHEADSEDRVINTVVPIAALNNLILDSTDEPGRQLAEMKRALHVGGVKFTVCQELISIGDLTSLNSLQDFGVASSQMCMDTKTLLVSDRMVTDPSDGLAFPQAIDSNFFTNTMPVTRISEIQDIQSLYPARIHWQNYKRHNAGFAFIYNQNVGETEDEHPFARSQTDVSNTHSGGNLKLRLRLQDDECLSFFFTSQVPSALQLTNFGGEVRFTCTGTIWYRYQ